MPITEEQAIQKAVDEIKLLKLNPTDAPKNIEDTVNMIAQKWGVNYDKVIDEWLNQVKDVEPPTDKSYYDDLKNDLVDTALQRLPRFISAVVRHVPVKFMVGSVYDDEGKIQQRKHLGVYDKDTKEIELYYTLYAQESPALLYKDYLHTLGHEYWHAFEDQSGFQDKLSKEYNDIVNDKNLLNIKDPSKLLGSGAIEELGNLLEFIDQFSNEELSKELEEFMSAWSGGYFDYYRQEEYFAFIDRMHLFNDDKLISSLSENLADTLGNIVIGQSKDSINQSLVTWMNKKFSSKLNQFNWRIGMQSSEIRKIAERIASHVIAELSARNDKGIKIDLDMSYTGGGVSGSLSIWDNGKWIEAEVISSEEQGYRKYEELKRKYNAKDIKKWS